MRATAGRRARWIGILALGAAAVALWWTGREGGDRRDDQPARDGGTAMVAEGGVLVVHGNPGWSALSPEERRRAETPLSDDARRWLRAEREPVRGVAAAFDVSPIALGGIVAAEKTLLVGRIDAVGEELFRAILGSLREQDLERWVSDQERAFREPGGAGRAAGALGAVRHPYLWTLGPAQVSFRLAIQHEPAVARRLGRPRRGAHEVLEALTSTPGNLEYAASLLADAERAYREVAGIDISRNHGVVATLYHLGAPTVRARRLAEENAARRARHEPVEPPHVNYYGAFVNHHAGEIAILLGAAGRSASR